jgi:hypothetical protein
VPIPDWVGDALQTWTSEAAITTGPIFRPINKAGRIPPHGFTPKVIWEIVKRVASACGLSNVAPMICGVRARDYAIWLAAS